MGTKRIEAEEETFSSTSSDEEEYENQMTTIEKSFINRRRFKSIIAEEDTLERERLQLMKFTLSQFLMNFAKQSSIDRELQRLKNDYRARKLLILGITMRLKECLLDLTLNQSKPEKDQKSFMQIVYEDETQFANKMHQAMRNLLLKRMETTGPQSKMGGIHHLYIIEELQKTIQSIHGLFMHRQTASYI